MGASAGFLAEYPLLPGTHDEFVKPDGTLRDDFGTLLEPLLQLGPDQLQRRAELAELALLNQGITFSVYGDDAEGATERVFPFCLIPRVIAADVWRRLEKGLIQRVQAMNLFLADIYGPQRILENTKVAADVIMNSGQYVPRLRGIVPPGEVRTHISGIDLIRDQNGAFRVLEDNLRCPSGVSYVMENRVVTKRVFPQMFKKARVRGVRTYSARTSDVLRDVGPRGEDSTVMLLTPGTFNSAYFEHTYLARTMGVSLVEAADLFVDDEVVYARTTHGPQRVDVLYRRTDDEFIDPEFFRPDSLLGVPGLMRAYAAGNVALANAPGNGVGDDKSTYPFVPEIIRFYLGEEPLLGQIKTHVCAYEDERKYVLEHLDELVVKAVDGAGGKGMLMGPQSTKAEQEEFRAKITAEPRRYIAQPLIELSSTPTWIPEKGAVEPRRVDLRPYVVMGKDGPWVLSGGLTRVALRDGSYVVNSSQGGGSKDTWVLSGDSHGGFHADQ